MDLILDTCGFLSLVGLADRPLKRACKKRISACDRLLISACSHFEISLKYKRGRLDLADFRDDEALWTKALDHYGIEEIPVTGPIFRKSVRLPDHHADPFDRIIIAQASNLVCPVVTYDPLFDDYEVDTIN